MQGRFEMKTQMRVQKILMLVSLVVAALVFVYALFFMTGGLADVYRYIEDDTDYINCTKFVSASGSFVSALVALGIVLIVLVVVMYLMANNSRRKYYITNYVSVALFVVMAVVVAFFIIIMVGKVMNLYQHDIRWTSGEGDVVMRTVEILDADGNVIDYDYPMVATNYADQAMFYPNYPLDPNQVYNFVLGFIVAIVVLADAVCVALCTGWKFLLIKGENKLLAAGAPAAEGAGEIAEVAVADATKPAAEEIAEEAAPQEEPVSDSPVKEEE